MSKSHNPFGVQVNGQPIDRYVFKPSAATGQFGYTLDYEQEQARIYAGLSILEYDALPGSPMWIKPSQPTRSKCHILMLYRMSNRMEAVSQDLQARAMERNRRTRGNR